MVLDELRRAWAGHGSGRIAPPFDPCQGLEVRRRNPSRRASASLPDDGLGAVAAACVDALGEGVHSADVVLNILARRRPAVTPVGILTPDALKLRFEPVADCAPYDDLRRVG